RPADLVAIHLGQPVHRLRDEVGSRVLDLVPFFPHSNIFDPKIRRKVDYANPILHERPSFAHCDGVGRGEEDCVTLAQIRFRRIRVGKVYDAAQAGEDFRRGRPGLLAGCNRHELGLGMSSQDPQQLDSSVAGSPDDSDLDHRSSELTRRRVHRFSCAKTTNKKAALRRLPCASLQHQRLEYCLRRRALCRPTFFRSTSRASRVTSPALLSKGLSAGSYSISARVNPWRTAPACPNSPPPETFTSTSNCVTFSVSTSGCRTTICPVSRAKYSFAGRSLTMKSPFPGLMNTRATELLRRPVP